MAIVRNSKFALLSTAFLLVTACGSETTGGADPDNITNPDVLQASASEFFVPTVDGVLDGLDRLLSAIAGGAADGVAVSAAGPDAYVGQVSLDLDGDGIRESTVSGRLDGQLDTGADVTISGLTQPGVSGLVVTASVRATQTTPGMVALDQMEATFKVERPSTENEATAVVNDGTVSLDAMSGTPVGLAEVTVSEKGRSLPLSLTFSDVSGGGWQARIVGDGVDFTVP